MPDFLRGREKVSQSRFENFGEHEKFTIGHSAQLSLDFPHRRPADIPSRLLQMCGQGILR
jgi:hypothetical protein